MLNAARVSSRLSVAVYTRRAPGSIGTRSNSQAVPRRSFGESAKDSLTFGFQPAAPRMQMRTSLCYLPDLVNGMALCEFSKKLPTRRLVVQLPSVTTRRWKTCATTMHNVRMRCSVRERSLTGDFTERALDNFRK